jgi:hypothetical protein
MNDRVRRPRPERTEPIRNWSTMFGGAPTGDAAPATGMADAVQRSVDLAYRVVDEYVRQGQRAAERFTGRGGAALPSTGDMQDAAAQMTRFASDGMRIWLEMMGVAMAGAGPSLAPVLGAAPATSPPVAAAGPAPEAATTRVRLALSTRRPVEVAVDLRPEASRAELVAHALRAADADIPPLAGAAFELDPNGGPVTLRLTVPDDQPEGIYNGLVIDAASNRPVGTLSVRIGG